MQMSRAMTKPTTYRLSFNVSHPSLPANQIVASVGLPTSYARSVGTPNVTKSGVLLGGNYARTDMSFAITDGIQSEGDVPLDACLREAMSFLPQAEINKICSSGGSCFILVGLYTEDNVFYDFDLGFLEKMVVLHVELKFDIYGGSE
jgi:hypothetical protein